MFLRGTHKYGSNVLTVVLDDPELWKTQPVTVQVVGRPCRDEALIAACEIVDQVINDDRQTQPGKNALPEREVARL